MSVELQLIAHECQEACANEPDFEKRARKAMAVVVDSHWMYPGKENEDLRFRGAIAAVLLDPKTTEDEKQHIQSTLRQLQTVSALLRGVPVNTEAMLKDQEDNPPLPLMAWWRELRTKEKAA